MASVWSSALAHGERPMRLHYDRGDYCRYDRLMLLLKGVCIDTIAKAYTNDTNMLDVSNHDSFISRWRGFTLLQTSDHPSEPITKQQTTTGIRPYLTNALNRTIVARRASSKTSPKL
jgi:hypothetical protein